MSCPSCSKASSGRPGDAREERRVRGRRALHRDGVEVPHVVEREPAGGGLADPFVRAREVLQDDHPALAVARVVEHPRDRGRGRGVVAQHQYPGARPDRGPERRGRASVQGEGLHVGQAPPEARAGEAERGRSGKDPHLVRGDVAGDHRADPVAEGVAGREDAHAAPRAGAELFGQT